LPLAARRYEIAIARRALPINPGNDGNEWKADIGSMLPRERQPSGGRQACVIGHSDWRGEETMRPTICLSAAILFAICTQVGAKPITHAKRQLNGTTWAYVEDGKKLQMSIGKRLPFLQLLPAFGRLG
jgi:hypothetical protein